MAVTTKEKIAVMQGFEDGKPIEVSLLKIMDKQWERVNAPLWNWDRFVYRIAVTKPSWDWSHVSDEINYLMRQSPVHGGGGIGLATRPEKTPDYWVSHNGFIAYAKFFTSYDPGTCDWRDSLVVRPGYVETGK